MNARGYLIHRLRQGLRGRDPEAIADLILNGHAHELAEEIRELGRALCSEDTMGAADMIDPLVKE